MDERQDAADEQQETLVQAVQRLKKVSPPERVEGKRGTAEIPFEGFDERPPERSNEQAG